MIPQGWAVHPQDSRWMFELANPQNIQQIPAPPQHAPPAPPAHAHHAPPASAGGHGPIDPSLIDDELAGLRETMGGDTLYLDFPTLRRPGEEAHLVLRLLPRAVATSRVPWLKLQQHFVYGRFVPEAKGERTALTCYDTEGCPGDCDVCKAGEEVSAHSGDERATDAVKRFKAQTHYRWQALDIGDPTKHFIQQGGQYVIKPGIFSPRKRLQRAILSIWKINGDPTHPDSGYPLVVTKRKTGPKDTDVEYHCVPQEKCPLDPQLRPVLGGLIDLGSTVSIKDRAVMRQVAANIMREFGVRNVDVGAPSAPAHHASPAYAPPPPPMASPYQPPPAPPAYAPPPPPYQPPPAPPVYQPPHAAPPPYAPPGYNAPPHAAPPVYAPPAPYQPPHAAPPPPPGHGYPPPPAYPAPPAQPGYPAYPQPAHPPAPPMSADELERSLRGGGTPF